MLLETPAGKPGFIAPSFTLKDPRGTVYTREAIMGDNGLLVAFICNHCPYVQAIITRFVADATDLLASGIGVVAIMPNDYSDYPDDSPAAMQVFAKTHNLPFPYLIDESQSVAKAYDAVCTPDFFGFNQDNVLCYRGRLDDAKRVDTTDRKPDLLQAMTQVAKTGSCPDSLDQRPSLGCSIKWRV